MGRSVGEELHRLAGCVTSAVTGCFLPSASCFYVIFPRMQRERAELEQNFAREIGNLVQRLSSEKDEMEAELKLEKDQEVMLVRWVEPVGLSVKHFNVDSRYHDNSLMKRESS